MSETKVNEDTGRSRGGPRRGRLLTAMALTLTLFVAQACTGATDDSGSEETSTVESTGDRSSTTAPIEEIVITCTGCEPSETDIFIAEANRGAEAFNEEYAGKYRIEFVPFAGINSGEAVSYLKRLAANDDLPDLFTTGGKVAAELGLTGRLVDFAPILDEDPEWFDTFYPDAFSSAQDDEGHIWGIPWTRNVIGTFWNKSLFEAAGVSDFPATWEELLDASERLKAGGVIPIAADGAWITLLWWANLIGTQPGGAEFLGEGILEGGYADRPFVVDATEKLKLLHTEGYASSQAFSGDFFSAESEFLAENAAMLANGPWEIASGITADSANEGLYDRLGYAPFPGNGVIAVSGEGAWASGAKTPEAIEAVTAFMKFRTSKEQQLLAYERISGGWPNQYDLTPEEQKTIDPLHLSLIEAANDAEFVYVHALQKTPTSFIEAWQNNWPAYVQGGLSTSEFLDKIAEGAMG